MFTVQGSSATCVLCGLSAEVFPPALDGSSSWRCPRCGRFTISAELVMTFFIKPGDKPFVSAATRQASESGNPITLTHGNLETLASFHRSTRMADKRIKLLKHIAKACRFPGGKCTLHQELDYPLIDAIGPEELCAFVNHAAPRHLKIEPKSRPGMQIECELTIDGWEAVEPHFATGGTPGRCFVATWFDDSMDDVYRLGIHPAVTECAFESIWMKDVETNQGITDRILSEIRLAEFIVADFTGQRQSVYFEAGFARGLGRQVISTCRKDEIEKLHFDTQHLGHIAWTDPDDLRKRLSNSIRANIIKPA